MNLENTVYDASLAESLQDIGERLQIIRLQKALDIEAIARRTNIPEKHLAAIESGNLEVLPELIYVRGFIRRYAQVLDQDVASFDLCTLPEETLIPKSAQSHSKMSVAALIRKLQYPLYALVVLGIGSGLIYLNNRDFSPAPAQSSADKPVLSQTSPESEAQ